MLYRKTVASIGEVVCHALESDELLVSKWAVRFVGARKVCIEALHIKLVKRRQIACQRQRAIGLDSEAMESSIHFDVDSRAAPVVRSRCTKCSAEILAVDRDSKASENRAFRIGRISAVQDQDWGVYTRSSQLEAFVNPRHGEPGGASPHGCARDL
jgi:hypothetical protein